MITPITITIPAGNGTISGILNYSARGKYFLTKATTGEFLVSTDTRQNYDFSTPGEGFGDNGSPVFKKLFFSNPNGTAVTVTFYASMTPIKTPDASITSTITASAALTNVITTCALETEGQFSKVTVLSNTAVAFAGAGTFFRRAIIIAQKTLDRAANTGNVYIGNSATHQSITLAPGDIFTIEGDTGGKRDLGAWYLSSDTAGDGISVLYV